MREIHEISFNEVLDIANISTNDFISSDMSSNIMEIVNSTTNRKLEYDFNIDEENLVKRFFEITIVNDKWYLYHGQFHIDGGAMLFVTYNEQSVKDYCFNNDINCKL